MVLVLAVHVIDDASAAVPLHIMHIHRLTQTNAIPPHFKLRQLIPTSGLYSTSLWDVDMPDGEDELAALKAFLDESMQGLCVSFSSHVRPLPFRIKAAV